MIENNRSGGKNGSAGMAAECWLNDQWHKCSYWTSTSDQHLHLALISLTLFATPKIYFPGQDIVVLASKLVRPYPNQMLATSITYTKERYGQVPLVYIKYSNDHTFSPEGQEYVSSRCGPFKEVIELEGGHFNFLQRPGEFTKLLVSLAQKYSVY